MQFYWRSNRDHLLFQSFLDFKNILRYLTRLSLTTLYGKPFLNILSSLLDLCPHLSYLDFDASPEVSSMHPPKARKLLGDIGDLKCLENHTNLKVLKLVIYLSLKFLEHCKFPKSLVKISLYFSYIDWESYMLLENSPNDSPFKDLFEGLVNLKSIGITLFQPPQSQPQENQATREKAQKEFLLSLILRIPKEAHLKLTLTDQSWAKDFVEHLNSLNLRLSWESQLNWN